MSRRTRVSVGVAATAAAFGALLIPAVSASAATPAIQVTPNQNLLDGAVVTVDGSGFASGSTVYISECSSLSGDPAACDQNNFATATADSTGSFSGAKLTVHTGTVGNGTCDGSSTACGVGASDNPFDPANADVAGAPVTFSKVQGSPLTGLHKGDKVHVTGVALPPSVYVAIIQCGPDAAADGSGCDTNQADAVVTMTDANGNLAADFAARTGEMQSGDVNSTCPPAAGAPAPCSIVAEQIDLSSGTPTPVTTLGQLPIAFAPVTSPTSTTTVATSVSIKSTKSSVSTGQKFAVKGRATAGGAGVNGLVAKLYQRANAKHKWAKVANKTTATIKGAAGSYKFALKGLKHSEQYRVRTAKKQIGTVIYKAGVSKTVTVK